MIVPQEVDSAGHKNASAAKAELQIVIAKEAMDFPLEFEGTTQSPLTRMDAETPADHADADLREQVQP